MRGTRQRTGKVCSEEGGLKQTSYRRKGRLTLTIGSSHVRHGGILHHSCRANTCHHARVGTGVEGSGLAGHGELLCVIHDLLLVLVRGWPRLQLSSLGWGVVEDRACGGIWVAIGGRIHVFSVWAEGRPSQE